MKNKDEVLPKEQKWVFNEKHNCWFRVQILWETDEMKEIRRKIEYEKWEQYSNEMQNRQK